MKILIYIAAFLVAIGVLVAVHEFGHFWVARRFGFKVLRFSHRLRPAAVDAGRARRDRTEYCDGGDPAGRLRQAAR